MKPIIDLQARKKDIYGNTALFYLLTSEFVSQVDFKSDAFKILFSIEENIPIGKKISICDYLINNNSNLFNSELDFITHMISRK